MKTSTNARQPLAKRLPQRTCVACRQIKTKRELVRIVKTPDGNVKIDKTGKVSGRGTYLCNSKNCWEEGLKTNRLEYVLKTKLNPEDRESLKKYKEQL